MSFTKHVREYWWVSSLMLETREALKVSIWIRNESCDDKSIDWDVFLKKTQWIETAMSNDWKMKSAWEINVILIRFNIKMIRSITKLTERKIDKFDHANIFECFYFRSSDRWNETNTNIIFSISNIRIGKRISLQSVRFDWSLSFMSIVIGSSWYILFLFAFQLSFATATDRDCTQSRFNRTSN